MFLRDIRKIWQKHSLFVGLTVFLNNIENLLSVDIIDCFARVCDNTRQLKGVISMMEKKIRLKSFSEAFEFVEAAEKCRYDVDIYYNRVVVDAKSILGVMSMDLTRILTVVYRPEDSKVLEKVLDRFSADHSSAA